MAELNRRKSSLDRLIADRQRLTRELDDINAQIAQLQALNGVVARRAGNRVSTVDVESLRKDGRRRGRGSNTESLPIALHRLLQGQVMGVTEMAEAVQKAGYKTKSPNFRTIVNAALLAKANAGLFRKVSRGKYTAR
jgi:hypothetical protein